MNTKLIATLLLIFSVMFSSCELVGDIFEAGVWAGVLLVVGIVALIIFIVSKLFSKK